MADHPGDDENVNSTSMDNESDVKLQNCQIKDGSTTNNATETLTETTNTSIKTTTATSTESSNETTEITEATKAKELVDFKVIYNKQKYDVSFPLDDTVATLKQHIQVLTGVPPAMQKVMFKGLAKEDKTLRELGIVSGTKLMVVGSTLNDVLAVNTPSTQDEKESDKDGAAGSTKEPLCKQKMHKKILDKGLPDDVMIGIKNEKDSLPAVPLSGMLNKGGGKVRLTFKLEVDQLWIGTKERTDKIPMNSIKNVTSEPIEGHEEYHIMGIQLGPTEASQYWIYWVPSQYVDAIKDAILGKWQLY